MVEAKVWILKQQCQGVPKLTDFECKTETIAPCEDGEVLIQAEWLSVDPYMRYRIAASKPGDTIVGSQVAKVIESRNPDVAVGTYVVAYPGWRSHSKITKEATKDAFSFQKLGDLGGIRRSAALGILGMPGNTAYFGFLELCQPKACETVVVNAAAGAVGSAVCQIAKIKGCRVIAFAGTPAKVEKLRTLGLDYVFNYKTEDVSESLKKAAPKGVDCYFDNVGGDFTAAVLPHLSLFARVSVCGAIATYNARPSPGVKPAGPFDSSVIITKQLKIEGFIVSRWASRWMEGINALVTWIKEGKLKYDETVTEGFEKMPAAFIGLFEGENLGKAVIKC